MDRQHIVSQKGRPQDLGRPAEHAPACRPKRANPLWSALATHVPPVVQAKLEVGAPDDEYEHEADRVADQVLRMPESPVQGPREEEEPEELRRKPRAEPTASFLQREAEPEEEEEIGSLVQTKGESHGDQGLKPNVASTIETLPGRGEPLPASSRAYFEPRFGRDLRAVKIHTGAQAAAAARAVNAKAFTMGNDVAFGPGQYAPTTQAGKHLLAHELTHVVQQRALDSRGRDPGSQRSATRQGFVQRTPGDEDDQSAQHVFVIGSPSPAEIAAGHPYQFVDAAFYQGVDERTVWIVERTGYEAGRIDVGPIESRIRQGRLIWLTPQRGLVQILNRFPASDIDRFSVYSHGLPGQVTLRYGWADTGRANYGLSIPEVRSMRTDLFTENARITFDSCNTGTSDFAAPRGNLAQQFAQRSGHAVEAWTGRTSYADVNAAQVGPSRIVRYTFRPDVSEVLSQVFLGRTPERRTFRPISGRRIGGFRSYFEISSRLPSTRQFQVPAGGSVAAACPNPGLMVPESEEGAFARLSESTVYGTATESDEDYAARIGRIAGRFWVALYRAIDYWPDESIGMHTFPVAPNDERAVWTNLTQGTYYLEVYRLGGNPALPVRSDIMVDIYTP